jgi:hypothetical protein
LPRLNGWTRKKSLLFLGVVFITGLGLSFIFQNPAPLILAVIGSISYGSEYTTSQACNNAVSCDTIDSTHFVLVHRGGDVFYQLCPYLYYFQMEMKYLSECIRLLLVIGLV